jgi:hypothetical protein
MIRYLKSPFAIASLLTCAYLMGPVMTQAGESESVATIVAVHIRSQGFRCENPISAQHAPQIEAAAYGFVTNPNRARR